MFFLPKLGRTGALIDHMIHICNNLEICLVIFHEKSPIYHSIPYPTFSLNLHLNILLLPWDYEKKIKICPDILITA